MSRQSEIEKIMKYIPSLSGRIDTLGVAEDMVNDGIGTKDRFEVLYDNTGEETIIFRNGRTRINPVTTYTLEPIDYTI